jgi:hypothetical protein
MLFTEQVNKLGYVFTTFLNFILWGSGTFLERRQPLQLLPVLLHVYLYGIALLLFASPIVWIIFVPVLGLGGAYFTLNDRRLDDDKIYRNEDRLRKFVDYKLSQEGNAAKRQQKHDDEISDDDNHFCTSCGKKVPSRARFCSNCGESQGKQ